MREAACGFFAICQLICQEIVKTPLLGICKPQVRARCLRARQRGHWLPHNEVVVDLRVMSGYCRVLAFFPMYLFQNEWKPGLVSTWHSTAQGFTTAGWWYIAFSAPLFCFTLFRWTFRYFHLVIVVMEAQRFEAANSTRAHAASFMREGPPAPGGR